VIRANLEEEWNAGSLLLMMAGLAFAAVPDPAEERILSRHAQWPAYAAAVRSRLIPGVW
jgi:hypothetical protein